MCSSSPLPTEVPRIPLKEQLSQTVAAMQKGGILYSEALTEFRRQFLTDLILRCGGNQSRAARVAGMHRNTLQRACRELGIDYLALRREVQGKGEQQRLQFERRQQPNGSLHRVAA